MNLVIDNTVEMNGEEKSDIGMVVIRENNVVIFEDLEPVNSGICNLIMYQIQSNLQYPIVGFGDAFI
ncbi:Probable small nuclear ribonucleoprotein G [Linum grandiflorum]